MRASVAQEDVAGLVGHARPRILKPTGLPRGVRAGTEYYAGLGPINHIAPLHEQQHTVFLAFDVDRKPFVFNFGIGRGLTRASDRWTLKWIFEIPLS